MTAPAPEILRRVAAGTAGVDDLEWLRERLSDYLDQPERGLDAALWLDRAPGEPPWWLIDRRRRRDGLILRLWRERFPRLSAWEAAGAIAELAGRYEGTAWPRHRAAGAPPADAALALLYEAFSLRVGFPRSQRQLHRVLNEADRSALY